MHLVWLKTVPQQPTICIKSGSPMILMSVVSTKTSAGDPTAGGRKGEHVASLTDTASSNPSERKPRELAETPAKPSLSLGEATTFTDPSPAVGARRTRSERSLREQLFVSDLAAVTLAWGLAMLFQSRLRPDQSIVVWLAAALSTLVVIQMGRLYRSWVCSEFSRQAARIIAATAVGGCVLAASGWLAGSISAVPAAPAVEGAVGAAALIIVLRWRFSRWLKNKRADGHFLQTVVLVGTNEDAGVLGSRIRTAPVSGLPMLYVEAHRPPTWHQLAKRATDIMTAAVLLPLSAPVLLLAAICIRLEDRGPVLYRHAVIGRYGVQTEVPKLRTMVPNAAQMQDEIKDMNEREGGPLFKASNDPRVTRIGRLLRDTSIDELPQLWDVPTGRMSLVGPRFAMPKEAAQFDEELRRRRTVMRPGITGSWQTEARDNPSFSTYRRLDLLYVDNWSLGLDLAILVNTAHAVIVRAMRAVLPRGGHRRPGLGSAAPQPSLTQTRGADPC